MQKVFPTLWQISLYTLGYLYATSNTAFAQISSDGTVNTQVNQNGNVAEITGGETRGNNLFHSFQDFSVITGNEAAFLNANDIANIFSRVTGGNISNIDGLISANGSANLFLINPAGIIFGENARLNIGGSFYGSSADSILFEDGEFSATDLDNPPVLTINAPIGLNFRDDPGDIVNRSVVENSSQELVGLEVLPGNNLAFIGGNIKFEGGKATARGGDITLGGLSEAGIVSINEDASFSFPEDITKADITLSNGAYVNAMGTGGGNIAANARNLSLTAREADISLRGIQTGISSESTSAEAQAGDVNINVAEKLVIDNSGIFNQVYPEGVGNAGNITINTGSLEAINGGKIEADTLGKGNVGDIKIATTGDITFAGESSDGLSSGIQSGINGDGLGNAGGIRISTNNLNLTNGGEIDHGIIGRGNTGTVDIKATGDVTLAGKRSDGFSSRIIAQVFGYPISDTGEIIAPRGVGDVGGVRISTNNLTLTDGGEINASTYGEGDAGTVAITATGDVTIAGENLGADDLSSGIFSTVYSDGLGDAGGIKISTTNLTLTNGGQIDASTSGKGNGGTIVINASESIALDGISPDAQFFSGILNVVNPSAVGNSGSIDLTTTNLSISNGAIINASTFGKGNGGTITVNASESVALNGTITVDASESIALNGTSPYDQVFSGILSSVGTDAVGNSGSIDLTTANLSISNGVTIIAATLGNGNGGIITINASESITLDGTRPNGFGSAIFNGVGTGAVGNAGSTELTTPLLSISNNAGIVAFTQGDGNAGDLTFNISDRLTLEENSIISARAYGTNNSGGNITINAQDGFVVAFPNQNPGIGNDILADSPAGIDGDIEIYAQGVFGLTERDVLSGNNQLENNSNDIDASGTISGSIPTIFIPREIQDLPPIISAEQTTDSACQASSDGTAKNGLIVKGKGGVHPAPDQPLASEDIINNEIAAGYVQPKPIVTRLGKIQLARGIKVTKDGRVILTPYATNNAGERMAEINPNCS